MRKTVNLSLLLMLLSFSQFSLAMSVPLEFTSKPDLIIQDADPQTITDGQDDTQQTIVATVSEPSSLVLLILAMVAGAGVLRFRRKNQK